MAKAPAVLMLIIDQMIKADEEIFSSFKVRAVIVHLRLVGRERAAKRSILSITPESSSVSHAE